MTNHLVTILGGKIIMGVYDMLPKGSQVKLWSSEMEVKRVGDAVPDYGLDRYAVLLREGGHVLVEKGTITKIIENHGRKYYYPEDFPNIICFDKWGCEIGSRSDLIGQFQGMMGMDDPYYFRSKE